jgi:hypothetical protein
VLYGAFRYLRHIQAHGISRKIPARARTFATLIEGMDKSINH